MKYRRRIYYSATQRAEIWDRWQRGESMSSIGRVFDRQSSSVFSVISPTGGIRPPGRRRGSRALIPTVIDQNPCAHLRMPRDMIFHGWSMRLFQAWQHSATMSS